MGNLNFIIVIFLEPPDRTGFLTNLVVGSVGGVITLLLDLVLDIKNFICYKRILFFIECNVIIIKSL